MTNHNRSRKELFEDGYIYWVTSKDYINGKITKFWYILDKTPECDGVALTKEQLANLPQ